jgi:hypothetical protein
MRKGTGVFKKVEETKTVCDECGEDILTLEYIHYDGRWNDGYDNYGHDYDFCSLDCLLKAEYNGNLYIPPQNEDVKLEVPVKFFNVLLSKLGE